MVARYIAKVFERENIQKTCVRVILVVVRVLLIRGPAAPASVEEQQVATAASKKISLCQVV